MTTIGIEKVGVTPVETVTVCTDRMTADIIWDAPWVSGGAVIGNVIEYSDGGDAWKTLTSVGPSPRCVSDAAYAAGRTYRIAPLVRSDFCGAVQPAPPPDPFAGLHVDGLVAEYRFGEGSGTTIADQTGVYGIDLADKTRNPNVTWTARGVRTQSGKIETPVIAGARTIAFLYRYNTPDAGFAVSGGNNTSDGWYNTVLRDFEQHWIGQGNGIFEVPVRHAANVYELQTGGWRLGFRQLARNYTKPFAFGGRQGTTSHRCADFEVAWVGIYDDVLSEGEREAIYATMRIMSRRRGFYIDWRDCPQRADAVLLWGQSNADGRAPLVDLPAAEQAQTFTKVKIGAQGLDGPYTSGKPMANLELGTNQNNDRLTEFGPELGLARARVASGSTRPLYISKCAEGGTWMAPSTDPNVAIAQSWSVSSGQTATGFWLNALPHWRMQMAAALDAGIGLDLKALLFVQGEQDADAVSTANVWSDEFRALVETTKAQTTFDLKVVVSRIAARGAAASVEAYETVRAAQVAGGAGGTIDATVDADGFSQSNDLHYDANGQLALGAALHAAAFGA